MEKSLLKMRKVGYQYPTQTVQQLYDITLKSRSRIVSLDPRQAPDRDLEPNHGGETWKHPNFVIGYVSQHAIHHIDHHLDKTPLTRPRSSTLALPD